MVHKWWPALQICPINLSYLALDQLWITLKKYRETGFYLALGHLSLNSCWHFMAHNWEPLLALLGLQLRTPVGPSWPTIENHCWPFLACKWEPLLVLLGPQLRTPVGPSWPTIENHCWPFLACNWEPLLALPDPQLRTAVGPSWSAIESPCWTFLACIWEPLHNTVAAEELLLPCM